MKIIQIIRSSSFIVISIFSFIFADSIDSVFTGYHISNETYGADAYTGIQNATAQTGINIRMGNDIIAEGFQYLFILIGLFFLLTGLTSLLGIFLEKKKNAVESKMPHSTPPPLPQDKEN